MENLNALFLYKETHNNNNSRVCVYNEKKGGVV